MILFPHISAKGTRQQQIQHLSPEVSVVSTGISTEMLLKKQHQCKHAVQEWV